MLKDQMDNAADIDLMKLGLLNLSRFYMRDKQLDADDATSLAVQNLLEQSYIDLSSWSLGDLHVPRIILQGGEIQILDQDNLSYNLKRLRSDIINHKIEYDRQESFGVDDYRAINEINDALRSGYFRLTSDKKCLEFAYIGSNEEYILRDHNNQKLLFPLLELNAPIPPYDWKIDSISGFELH